MTVRWRVALTVPCLSRLSVRVIHPLADILLTLSSILSICQKRKTSSLQGYTVMKFSCQARASTVYIFSLFFPVNIYIIRGGKQPKAVVSVSVVTKAQIILFSHGAISESV